MSHRTTASDRADHPGEFGISDFRLCLGQCRRDRTDRVTEAMHDQSPIARETGVVIVRRLEAATREPRRATPNVFRRRFEAAGAEFIGENGGGPGARLRHRPQKNR